jgi:hypothetical protein
MVAKENEAVAVAGETVLGAKHKTLAELEKIKDDAIAKKKEELQVSLERSLAQDGKLAEDASNADASLPQINMERDWLRASMDKARQRAKTWIAVAEQTYQESVEERQGWQREKNARKNIDKSFAREVRRRNNTEKDTGTESRERVVAKIVTAVASSTEVGIVESGQQLFNEAVLES